MPESIIRVEQPNGSYRDVSPEELRRIPNLVFEGIDGDEEADRTISWYRLIDLDDPYDVDRSDFTVVGDPGERLLERGNRWAQEIGFDGGSDGGDRYTIFCAFPDEDAVEEIDVDATDERIARELGEVVLCEDYEDGLRIVGIEKRFGYYM